MSLRKYWFEILVITGSAAFLAIALLSLWLPNPEQEKEHESMDAAGFTRIEEFPYKDKGVLIIEGRYGDVYIKAEE